MPVTSRARRGVVVAAVAVIALAGLTACTASTPDDASAVVVPSSLWDSTAVHSISLDIAPADSDAIIAAYLADGTTEWARASVTVDGTSLDDVGVAIAGAPALDPDATETDLAGLPWLIRFDEFVDGQNIEGETELRLSGNKSSTALNESLSLELLAIAGLATESSVPTSFTVNGGSPRLRLVVQQLDQEWVADQFDAGDLVYAAQPGGDFSYRGDDAVAYDGSFDQVAGADDPAPLARFLKFVENSSDTAFATQLQTYLDVDAFAVYLAFEDVVREGDGPQSSTALEYSDTTKLMTVIPWELSASFSTTGSEVTAAGAIPSALTARFLAAPEFAEVYEQAVLDANSLLFETGTAESILADQTAVLTEQASGLVSTKEIRAASKALKEKLDARTP